MAKKDLIKENVSFGILLMRFIYNPKYSPRHRSTGSNGNPKSLYTVIEIKQYMLAEEIYT